jgi:hypothetical protein
VWAYEHSIETSAAPEAIWQLWADVQSWGRWNADIEKIEIRGPFAAGSEITMTPAGQNPVRLRIAGPAITADWAETMASLVGLAQN